MAAPPPLARSRSPPATQADSHEKELHKNSSAETASAKPEYSTPQPTRSLFGRVIKLPTNQDFVYN